MTKTHETKQHIESLMPSRALPALLDFRAVCEYLGFPQDRSSRLRFWRGAKNGTFPAPVKSPGGSRIYWRREEIERWLSELPRAIYAKVDQAKALRS